MPNKDTMRAFGSVLLAMSCLAVGACAYTSSSPFAEYHELPPAPQRKAVGAWDLGNGNCRGGIHTVAEGPYWVIDCRIKAGFGHCTHGLPLVRRGSSEYVSKDGRIVFAIVDSGDLEEKKDGRLVGRYTVSRGQICGVAAEKSSVTDG